MFALCRNLVGLLLPLTLWSPGFSDEPIYDVARRDANDQQPLCGSPEHGYALLLPGVLGTRFWDRNVAANLRKANFAGVIEIFDWTRKPRVLGLNNLRGNRHQALVIAEKIVNFQDRYPGRPVFLLGHSGGCKMAVHSLESLPSGYQVDRAILLASCLESGYDLRAAMLRTRFGFVAFPSILDVPVSQSFTTLIGMSHGKLNFSSGVFGFKAPSGLNSAEKAWYERMLVQQSFSPEMFAQGIPGGHFGTTSSAFVVNYVAPILVSSNSPFSDLGTDAKRGWAEPFREANRETIHVSDGPIHMNFSG